MNKTILLSISLLLFSGFSAANLTVIADLGGQSVAPFYDAINPQDEAAFEHQATFQTPLISEAESRQSFYFPVVTTRLQPGQVHTMPVDLPNMQPLFLIGDDPLSFAWLQEKRTHLKAIDAVGLVVNVDNTTQFETLQNIVPDIELHPISADDLTDRLSLTAYPVLITATEISQ